MLETEILERTSQLLLAMRAHVLLMALEMTVSQHEQYTDPESEQAKWNPAIINFIMYGCISAAPTCQNILFNIFEVAISLMPCLAICQAPNGGFLCIGQLSYF